MDKDEAKKILLNKMSRSSEVAAAANSFFKTLVNRPPLQQEIIPDIVKTAEEIFSSPK